MPQSINKNLIKYQLHQQLKNNNAAVLQCCNTKYNIAVHTWCMSFFIAPLFWTMHNCFVPKFFALIRLLNIDRLDIYGWLLQDEGFTKGLMIISCFLRIFYEAILQKKNNVDQEYYYNILVVWRHNKNHIFGLFYDGQISFITFFHHKNRHWHLNNQTVSEKDASTAFA